MPQGRLPLLLDWIEGRVVVTRSLHEEIERGDIVERLDGVGAERGLLDAERYISGSPQWKRFRALRSFGAGDVRTLAELTLLRGDERLELQVERQQLDAQLYEYDREDIELLEDGVYYVDLVRAEIAAINERIAELAAARGVVFDVRGYPNGNHQVISHLLSSPDTSTAWMRVPHIIYPDLENVVEFAEFGWQMPALEPHIGGKVVFITDGRAISYAESFMGFIEGYGLAEIVGQPTAGTNGNVNPFTLPGGFRISWTGMKVVKHDGSQHHLIGIRPTVPAERTIQGVIDGRDEFLEKALAIIALG
jgi:C-terminal processing protease CtpA/Prc